MLVALTAVAEAWHTTETEQARLPKSAENTDAHTLIKAPANRTDTLSTYEIPEVVVNTSPKQDASQAISTTSVGMARIRSEQIEAVRDLSLITPNLYIPDYGSKMTSSIYIRGIGARIDQPAIGLYVDNIPYLNKNNYDFGFYDIRQVEVLRGPQSSLYGRNTIGGVINLYTLSPLDYQGVRIGVEYGSANTFNGRVSVYEKPNDSFGYSVAAYYDRSDGFFKNAYDNRNCDWSHEFGFRNRIVWLLRNSWSIDNTLSINNVRQGGFPYAQVDSTGKGTLPVCHDDPCSYDRFTLSEGISIRHTGSEMEFSSITSYQYTNDEMVLDQDFQPRPIFTLIQSQNEHAVTQDFVFRTRNRAKRWQTLCGLFGFFKYNDMRAPVTFKRAGIDELILENINAGIHHIFPDEDILIRENQFVITDDFKLPTWGAALYHQSTLHLNRWTVTAGIRFDYEHAAMRHDNSAELNYRFTMTMPEYRPLVTTMSGKERLSFYEFLPRLSASYRFQSGNLYASVAKGYKAGGFNTQIFSDILQSRMMNDMMEDLGVYPEGSPSASYDNASATTYKPEHNWNYEIGGHFLWFDGSLKADLALFYIDCRNQQLTVFPPGKSTGRMMSNAGRTRSYGAETSISYSIAELTLNGSYGYTNARFLSYNSGTTSYAGNYIPYAPTHTFALSGDYSINVGKWIDRILLHCDLRGAGPFYWNEENSLRQPFYSLLGASVGIQKQNWTLSFWGSNLTGTDYDVFYFMSIGNSFVQHGKPRQLGVSLQININTL